MMERPRAPSPTPGAGIIITVCTGLLSIFTSYHAASLAASFFFIHPHSIIYINISITQQTLLNDYVSM